MDRGRKSGKVFRKKKQKRRDGRKDGRKGGREGKEKESKDVTSVGGVKSLHCSQTFVIYKLLICTKNMLRTNYACSNRETGCGGDRRTTTGLKPTECWMTRENYSEEQIPWRRTVSGGTQRSGCSGTHARTHPHAHFSNVLNSIGNPITENPIKQREEVH